MSLTVYGTRGSVVGIMIGERLTAKAVDMLFLVHAWLLLGEKAEAEARRRRGAMCLIAMAKVVEWSSLDVGCEKSEEWKWKR